MQNHGYCIGLWDEILNLGYDVIEHKLLDVYTNQMNPTGVTIISKKKGYDSFLIKNPLAWPITNFKIELTQNCYFSMDASLTYPIIDSIPCLLPENAILATHFAKQ